MVLTSALTGGLVSCAIQENQQWQAPRWLMIVACTVPQQGPYFTNKDALADHYKSEFHR